MAIPTYSLDQAVNALWTAQDELYYFHQPAISYGFLTDSTKMGGDVAGNLMTNLMKAQATTAIELWDDVINVNLNQAADNTTADITMYFSKSLPGSGQTSSNHNGVYASPETIQLNDGGASTPSGFDYTIFNYGGWGFQGLLLHEFGHGLGLDHPGPYDSGQNVPLTYANNAAYTHDSVKYSVMSYFGAWTQDAGGYWTFKTDGDLSPDAKYPQTPMLEDIAAVQKYYGADYTTRHDSTTYGFNTTADIGAYSPFNFTFNPNPIVTIWDGGGTADKIDASGFIQDQVIDLHAGKFSDIGALRGNVAIAYGSTIEDAAGGSGNDTLYGNDSDNELWGNAGNDKFYGYGGEDILHGGANDDTYVIDALDSVAEAFNEGHDTVFVTFSSSYALPANVEDLYVSLGATGNVIGNGGDNKMVGNIGVDTLTGALGDDYLIGGQGDDKLNGGDGQDVLDGGAGADQMNGGNNTDYYYVDNIGDTITEAANQDTDFVYVSVSGYAMDANVEVGVITSTTGLVLAGNASNNTLWGNVGNDSLKGAGGADTMYGGGGNDTYFVDNAGDIVVEYAGGGDDTVHTTVDYTIPENVQTLYLDGTATSGTGNSTANSIYGNGSDNVIDGKGGADIMQGFGGNDYYFLDVAGDHIVEAGGQGTDTAFVSFDGYALETDVEVGVVNTTAGRTLYGNPAPNTLHGGSGNDTLNGKGGADDMRGHGGDDFYYVDNAGDTITELANEGLNDRAFTSVSYALGTGVYVEKLTTADNAGTASLTLSGNELGNTIFGNAGSNAIYGGAGNDTLVGMGGPDAFVFDTALHATNNVDNIGDFNPVDDGFVLAKAIFSAIVGTDLLPAGAFYIGSAAHDADDRIIYNSQAGALYYDPDGTAGGAAVQFATLAPGLALSYADFMLV